MTTCIRSPPALPDVEVVSVRVRLDSEKQGHFYLTLRLRDPPRRPMDISKVRYKLKVGSRLFSSGFRTLEVHLDPGKRDLPEIDLPFAVEDPLSWGRTLNIHATGQVETGPDTDYSIGFDQRLSVEVVHPPPP